MRHQYLTKASLLTVMFVFCAFWGWALPQPPSNLNGDALKSWLKANYYDGEHHSLGYSTARKYMYNNIDNKNNKITCVYSGFQQDWNYGGTGTNPMPINCEHPVPQSFFGKSEPMRSDIHHLFPTYSNWNSTRSNYPFKEIDDNRTAKWMLGTQSQSSIPSNNIDAYSEAYSSSFEPREDHKGNVARAVFYFYTMYPTQAGSITSVANVELLYAWHKKDPVDDAERQRNSAIASYQGSRNPYIDYPNLVARAWNITTGPTLPDTPSLSATSSATQISLNWTNVNNETGYKIYKSSNGSSFSLLKSITANQTSYTDASVSASTTYTYYVVAYNNDGQSSNSQTVTGKLSGGNTGGGSSDGLIISEYIEGSSYNKAIEIANFTGHTVNLSQYTLKKQSNGAGSWANSLALSGNLADGTVYVIVNSNASSAFSSKADLATSHQVMTFNGNDAISLWKGNTQIDVVGQFNGSNYFGKDKTLVRKSDVNKGRTTYRSSEWTSYSSNTSTYLGRHNITRIDRTAPSIPNDLEHSNVTETGFALKWTASSDNTGIASYNIFRDGALVASSPSTSFTLSGLKAWTKYTMTVSAEDAAGNVSFPSSILTVRTADTTAPSAPTNLAASAITSNSFAINWDASTDNVGISEYEIFVDGISYTTTSAISYSFSSLKASTNYLVSVFAKDSAENLSSQTQISVQTAASNTGGSTNEIFFSEYIEGSSYNKALEIANFTGSPVDLSAYTISRQANGSGAWGASTALNGTLANGDVFVIAHNLAASTMQDQADLLSSDDAILFNGNDAVGLFKDGELIDILGVFNSNSYYAKDVTLVRNEDILVPNTTYDSNEWTSQSTNEFEYLGSHTVVLPTSGELFFSEYVEGSSYNKALEIANFTGAEVDLSIYEIRRQANGSGSWGTPVALTGMLSNDSVFVVAHKQASSLVKISASLLSDADGVLFNGNDAVGLFKNDELIDIIGVFNSGSNYAKDVTLVRNQDILAPNTTYDSNEWTRHSKNEFNYLGKHSITTGATEPQILVHEDFESGWNIWTDGGSDCSLYTDGTYAYSGTSALNIQDNSEVSSSFYLTDGIDIDKPGFTRLEIEFFFFAKSMEANEDFFVEYFDGTSWVVIEKFVSETDFDNNYFYQVSLSIDEGAYTFPADMKLRFRCDASSNGDDIFVDDITVTGTFVTRKVDGKKSYSNNIQAVSDFTETEETPLAEINVYPNPTSDYCTLKLSETEEDFNQVRIHSLNGQMVHSATLKANQESTINLMNLEKGIYILSVKNGEQVYSTKIVKE